MSWAESNVSRLSRQNLKILQSGAATFAAHKKTAARLFFYTCGKFLRMTFNIPKALDAPCTTQVNGLSTR